MAHCLTIRLSKLPKRLYNTHMKTIVAYRVVETGLVIPIRDWQSFDGLYYQQKGYTFEPIWSE